MSHNISLSVQTGNVLDVSADVVAFKYAQSFFGADRAAIKRLGVAPDEISLGEGSYQVLRGKGRIAAREALFVGAPPLYELTYSDIRTLGRRTLAILHDSMGDAVHVAVTVHGPGTGLDEAEACRAQVAGFLDAIRERRYPAALARITIVEIDSARAERLRGLLEDLFPDGLISIPEIGTEQHRNGSSFQALEQVGRLSEEKPRAFVAMPFAPEYEDYFHYGIERAAHAAGFLCERADLSTFVGDVMEWVKKRIEGATLVIADLTSANANVFLEVGYAWGCRIPTVLLTRSADHLPFNVRGQRCLVYGSIRQLEEKLGKELEALRSSLVPSSTSQWSR